MSDQSDRAVVLLSGGLDSTTCLAIAKKHHEEVIAISFLYGQKHRTEIAAAEAVARYYEAAHATVQLSEVVFHSDESSLTGDAEMPQITYKEIEEGEGVSPTYVPFRNANLLSMATAYAMTHKCGWLYAGMHAEDARGWAYPDCTPEFIGAMANAIYVGTYFKVRLVAPLQNMMKHEIVSLATDLEAPLWMTHSCYEGKRPACGMCPTCTERIGAFLLAGQVDPIEYEVDWRANRERYLSSVG